MQNKRRDASHSIPPCRLRVLTPRNHPPVRETDVPVKLRINCLALRLISLTGRKPKKMSEQFMFYVRILIFRLGDYLALDSSLRVKFDSLGETHK